MNEYTFDIIFALCIHISVFIILSNYDFIYDHHKETFQKYIEKNILIVIGSLTISFTFFFILQIIQIILSFVISFFI